MDQKITDKIKDLYTKIHRLSQNSTQQILIVKPASVESKEIIYLSPERARFYEIVDKLSSEAFFDQLKEAGENNEWFFVDLKTPSLSAQLYSNLNTLSTLGYAQKFGTDEEIKQNKKTVVIFIAEEKIMRDEVLPANFASCFAPVVWLGETIHA